MKCARKPAIFMGVATILATVWAQAAEPTGTKYALVIGIEKFQDKSFTPLRFCSDDAQAFYNLLVDPVYGGYPKDNTTLLRNKDATTANITEQLEYLASNAREEDTVTIFFSSHGFQNREGHSFWVTYDSEIDREAIVSGKLEIKKDTSLDNDTISALLDHIEARRLIVFLDCCYSADTVLRSSQARGVRDIVPLGVRGIVGTWPKKIEDPFVRLKGKGRVIISASDGNQKSVELPDKKHGAFTYYLLEGMRGEADENNDNVIEVLELWAYLETKIEKAASDVGTKQKPTLTVTKFTHRFPLSTYPMERPTPSRPAGTAIEP